MASIRKHGGGFRAEVARQGVRRSKVFPTKREAKDWAARQEYMILNGEKMAAATAFGDVMDRYAREVSPTKRGHRWEDIRLAKLRKDRIARKPVAELTPEDFADWRDRRMREVSAGSVRREMGLLGAVLTQARKEWGMIAASPLVDVRKPAPPKRRTRRISQDELDRLRHVAGEDLSKSTARAFHALLFSIETAMRAGEIIRLRPEHVDIERRVAHLPETKNGFARDVPLSTEAVRLLGVLPEADPVFGLSSPRLDALWRKIRDKAAIDNLTFHDARHEAITRLARKLDVLDLARMVGHRDIRELMTYYEADAEDMARRLG